MTTTADFYVNGSSAQVAHAVAPGSTVTLSLVDPVGVKSCAFEIVGISHSNTTIPVVTALTKTTASLVVPNGGSTDWGWRVRAIVDGGKGPDGKVSLSLVRTRVFGTTLNTGVVPLTSGETTERDATCGWVSALNRALSLSLVADQTERTPSPISIPTGTTQPLVVIAPAGLAPSTMYVSTIETTATFYRAGYNGVSGRVVMTQDVEIRTSALGVVTCELLHDPAPDSGRCANVPSALLSIAVTSGNTSLTVSGTQSSGNTMLVDVVARIIDTRVRS